MKKKRSGGEGGVWEKKGEWGNDEKQEGKTW